MGSTTSSTVVDVNPEFRAFRKWTFAETEEVVAPFVHSQLRRNESLPCASLDKEDFKRFLLPQHLTNPRLSRPQPNTKPPSTCEVQLDLHSNLNPALESTIISLQANVRRFLCGRRMEKWLLGSCVEAVEQVFDLFGMGNGPNPYDGAKSIDAHQVVVALLLLCEGSVDQKLQSLFRLFAIEAEDILNIEEAVVLLIVCLNAVRIICGNCAGDVDECDVESLAFSMRKDERSGGITYQNFVDKILEQERHAKWIDLFSSDCTLATFHLVERDWTVLVSSSEMFPSSPNATATCNKEEWISVVHGKMVCDVQHPRTRIARSFLVRVDRTKETLLHLEACLDGSFTCTHSFDFGPPQISFKLMKDSKMFSSVELKVSLRVRSEEMWSREDEVGLFEAASPLDTKSTYLSKRLTYGSLKQRVIKIGSAPDRRFVRLFQFEGPEIEYRWVDLRYARVALPNTNAVTFKVGSEVLLRSNPCCSCTCDVSSCCRFSVATITASNTKSKKLSAKCRGSQAVLSADFSQAIALSSFEEVSSLGKKCRKLLCEYHSNEFRVGTQIYSGKFELRYTDANGKMRSRSGAFEITPSPITFCPFSGGHLDRKLECSYQLQTDDYESINATVTLQNYLPSSSLEMVGCMQVDLCKAVIDPYYQSITTGGLFKVQLKENAEVVAESNYAVVTPIIELTPSSCRLVRNRYLRTQKLTCCLQHIPADRLWSNWDVVELKSAETHSAVAFKYIHWTLRNSGKATIILNESIPNGRFYWLFQGKSATGCRSEEFEVFEEVARSKAAKGLIESATVIQKIVRRCLGQRRYVAFQQAAEESTSALRASLHRATLAYEERRNANAKRNPVLLSMRDKVSEKKALKKVKELEQEIIKQSGIRRELTNEEATRINALQAMAREEASLRACILADRLECERRKKRREELYTSRVPLVDRSAELYFSEELCDLYDWYTSRDLLHTDRNFAPCSSSLGDMFSDARVQWRRVTDDPILQPFTETVELLQIRSKILQLDSLYLALHVLLQRGGRLAKLLNFDYAESGIWQVVLSDNQVIILDDWLPGVIDESSGEWKPLLSSPANGSAVLLIEKALAKMEGSYSALASAQRPAEEILARLFTGHFRSFVAPSAGITQPMQFVDDPTSLYISRSCNSEENFGDLLRLVSLVQQPDLFAVFAEIYDTRFIVRKICRVGPHKETLVQLFNSMAHLDDERWRWKGDWSDESKLWTKETVCDVGYDPIDDGSFWIPAEAMFSVVTSWGYTLISQPQVDSETCKTVLNFPKCEGRSFVVENPKAQILCIQLEAIDKASYVETRVDLVVSGSNVLIESMVLLPSVYSQSLVTTAKQFEIKVTPWLPGVKYKTRLRLFGATWRVEEEDFTGKPVVLPKDVCTGCYTPITEARVSLRGLHWHPSCFGCYSCLLSHGCANTQPSFPINVLVYCYETSKMRAVCATCWRTCGYSPKCATCGEHKDLQGSCPACELQKRIEAAEKCKHCHGPLIEVSEWSGKVVSVNKCKIHQECESAFKAASGRKCVRCKKPLVKSETYSGRTQRTRRGLMHVECVDGSASSTER